MIRKIQFSNGSIYHVFNRGVEKRDIFMDKDDHFRFIHDLFEFNDTAPAGKFSQFKLSEPRPPKVAEEDKRKLLVEVLAFCLMPNHFHLVLRQVKESGITSFMMKLAGGYAMYFNEKYERSGSLFQGRFKAIEIENEPYFLQLSRYIHLNPVGLVEPKWKESGVKDWKRANDFLENYRWSSYLDYIGKKNFPSLTSREFLLGLFDDNPLKYKRFVKEWAAGEIEDMKDLALEE